MRTTMIAKITSVIAAAAAMLFVLAVTVLTAGTHIGLIVW